MVKTLERDRYALCEKHVIVPFCCSYQVYRYLAGCFGLISCRHYLRHHCHLSQLSENFTLETSFPSKTTLRFLQRFGLFHYPFPRYAKMNEWRASPGCLNRTFAGIQRETHRRLVSTVTTNIFEAETRNFDRKFFKSVKTCMVCEVICGQSHWKGGGRP